SKTAAGSYDEVHTWQIEKSVNPGYQVGGPGDVLPWTWTVTVSETALQQNFAITGLISVSNPAGSPGSMTVALTDVLDDRTPVTLACGGTLTVAPGASETCAYSAAPSGQTATLNTVTATLNQIAFSATAPVTFSKTVVNGTAVVTDDQIGLSESLTAGNGPWVYSGPGSHTCSTDTAVYGSSLSYGATVDNTAVVTGSSGQSDSASASTEYLCSIRPVPAIDIEKATNGEDADTPTGPYIPVGDPVIWTYVVTNTGNVPLSDVVVTDDQGVSVTCPKTTLAVGESMTCTGSGIAEAGQYANLGTVIGWHGQTKVTDEDPSHYFGTLGALKVTKRVEWNRATPDANRSFEICVTGPSFAQADCVQLKNGESHTWTQLVPGSYVVSESPIADTLTWTVEIVYAGGADFATVVAEQTAEVTVLNTTDLESPPTGIDVSQWDVTVGQSGVLHTWQTTHENNVSGFRVYRGSSSTFGEAELVGEIVAKGQGAYQWVDSGVAAGAWYYWLVEVDGSGAEVESYGPKTATVGLGGQGSRNQRIYLPMTLVRG
ncbi:MAG: hypothetical protein GX601_19710, partial [Anaerolineales bacterium]|nr:hypothetical protein [Anaerolineales bacterium]